MTELVGGEHRTRAQRMYDDHRAAGSAFWHELSPPEKAAWIVAAGQQARAEAAETRLAELEAAARVYFREFDHLVGEADYAERVALRNALKNQRKVNER